MKKGKPSVLFPLRAAVILIVVSLPVFAQYDKVAGLNSDSSITPIGGPASAPPIEKWPYGLPDFRPTGRLNDHLPLWIQFGLEERARFEGYTGGNFNPRNKDAYVLNRFRWGMIIQPTDRFRIVAQVQNANSFWQTPPVGPPNENRWDLKLAYVQFGKLEAQHFEIRVGRQEIDYNNTLIANSEWRNQGRSYDAVVTNIRLNRFRAGIFAGSPVIPLASGVSHHEQGNNVYGIYGGIDRTLPHSAIEPFVLWRVAPSVPVQGATGTLNEKLNEKLYGFRVRGKDIKSLDYRFELAAATGNAGGNDIRGWASTFGAGYKFDSVGWFPRVFAGYDYASGDKNPHDDIRGTFDTLYPTAHDRFGITDQFGWQNIIAARSGVTFEPHHRWSVTGQFLDLWLAEAKDAVYNSSGSPVFRDLTGRSGTHLGREFDAYTWYEINREIHIGAGVGHLIPGEFLQHTSKGGSYNYPYFEVEMLDGKRVH